MGAVSSTWEWLFSCHSFAHVVNLMMAGANLYKAISITYKFSWAPLSSEDTEVIVGFLYFHLSQSVLGPSPSTARTVP